MDSLRERLLAVGFESEQVEWALTRVVEKQLVETNLKAPVLGSATQIRAAPAGAYYFSRLVRTFVYTDAVTLDTPIYDSATFSKITPVWDLNERIARARTFIGHLTDVHLRHPTLSSVLNWQQIAGDIDLDIQRAEAGHAKALRKKYGE